MLIHELRCFGLRAGEGNSALVVEGDHSDAAARQAYATAQGRSATVFIDVAPTRVRPDAGALADPRASTSARANPHARGADADPSHAAITLDYFYPHMRSPLCLHARSRSRSRWPV